MNLNDEILRNVLRIASQSAGFALRAWTKCMLVAGHLGEPRRVVPVRRPTSRRKFNRRAYAVHIIARLLLHIDAATLIQSP